MRTTPRVTLILKQASSAARLHKILAQKIVVTVVIQILHVFSKIPPNFEALIDEACKNVSDKK